MDSFAPSAQTQKKKYPAYGNDNVLESLRGVGTNVGKTIVKDVLARGGADVVRSIFGGMPTSGELRQNQVIEFARQPERSPEGRPVRSMETYARLSQSDAEDVKQKINAIRMELKALAKSISGLRQEVTKTVMEMPVDPGIYHLNFFEHLQSYLQSLKQEVDDSRTWLIASNNRKAKKGYWGMMKKHGTSFGMSNERAIASSAG